MPDTDAKEVETEEPSEANSAGATETPATDAGGSSGGVEIGSYLSLNDAEQETLQDWVIYLAALAGAISVAFGLNVVIQNQWAHDLIFLGPFYESKNTAVNPMTLIQFGLFVIPLLGAFLAFKVGHEEETPVKVAAVVSIVSMVVLGVVGGFLGVVTVGAVSINLVNTLVSSLGAGIAAAVGSIIAVVVTQEFAPDSLSL
ncbi:hypothetical protein GCM10028857_04670 [Salinarchaeum chitinilyticum]